MRERPILFSGPMVRAILDGRKTMTRRVVANVGADNCLPMGKRTKTHVLDAVGRGLCPYGQPGDRLWVRETFATSPSEQLILYRAQPMYDSMTTGDFGWKWKPSIHMPRWASRLTLEITEVRVERVQDISRDDARAEGVGDIGDNGRENFATLWNDLNASRGYGWDANPWVWVIAFKRVDGRPSESGRGE